MKPLIYGYMRVTDESDDVRLRLTEELLARHAGAEGCRLAMIFHDYTPGHLNTFTVLVEALQRSEAHHVIVPTLRHLACNRLMQEHLLDVLEAEADARVIEAGEPK